ncbi:MAG: EAL domain-containing protein [Myxococcota bacterium]|nr:EAL domain-containing protein [Myxococcota bacterium]
MHEEGESQQIELLLVEEDDLAAKRIGEMLSGSRVATFALHRVTEVDQALYALQHEQFGAVLMDLGLHDAHTLDSLLRARFAAKSVPIVVLAYQDDEALALRAVKSGAAEFLIKGEVSATLLSRTLLHAIERHRMLQEVEQAKARESFLARNDPLTRLSNRYAFREELGEAMDVARENDRDLSLVFVDLDGFKAVNDNLGHAAGDELLVDVANRLRRWVGEEAIVARLGGDEFVFTVPASVPYADVIPWAEELRTHIEEVYHVAGLETWVGASLGIATAPRDAERPDELTRCADAAMYQAKSLGRGRVCTYTEHLRDMASERFELINGLREAIHGGDLALVYQPQIDVNDQRIVAFEALVRWLHPVRGMVPPSEFIPVAEEAGMVVPLGEWVLRKAATVLKEMAPPDVGMAVNVSSRQLSQRDFAETVQRTIRELDLEPSRLEIELTESACADRQVIRSLHALREIGVRIAIDDFGTGYSSFTLLKDIPAHVVKIDKSFVQRARAGSKDEVILGAIIQMVTALGLDVIAEGIETTEAMNLLYHRGCMRMQGYLFSKPEEARDALPLASRPDAPWRECLERLDDSAFLPRPPRD